MLLATIDWILIAVYLLLALGIAFRYANRAGQNLGEFFLGGRSLPWYVLGISMVATTFAADTPLAVTEIVYVDGISGNWLWWNALIGGMLTTFFFAGLWRRANVLTEVEFITLRYSGGPARFLRGFKSIYLGVFMNVMIMGWVNLAFMGILQKFFLVDYTTSILVTGAAMLLVAAYSSLGGLLGVAITDVIQFGIAMAGSIVLAVLVLNSEEIGGISGLKEKLGEDNPVFNFFPEIGGESTAGNLSITLMAFLSFVGVQWWASWYPGAEPGGGGYVAQRMLSARTERDSVFATLFFQIAHYCLRPWPWILVGLCAMVLYPELGNDAKFGYVDAMRDFLPDGWRGLCLVAFLAAYMSTISTQLNWGASYLVNDFYRPFIGPEAKGSSQSESKQLQKHYILVSRLMTVVLMALALAVTTQLNSIKDVWDFIFQCGAGLGMVLIMRWFWWRINAVTEIVATATPFIALFFIRFLIEPSLDEASLEAWNANRTGYFITVLVTTLAWVATALLTKPEPMDKLRAFYRQVEPGGLWRPVYSQIGGYQKPKSRLLPLLGCWISAIILTYGALLGFGELILGNPGNGWIYLGVAALNGIILVVLIRRFNLFPNS